MAAPVARVSAFSAGHILFAPLAGRGARLNQPWCAATGRARGRRGNRARAWPCSALNPSTAASRTNGTKALTATKEFRAANANPSPVPAVCGGPAHENDRVDGQLALQNLIQQGCERRNPVLADAGSDGQPPAQWTRDHCGWRLAVGNSPRTAGPWRLHARAQPLGRGALQWLVAMEPALEPRPRVRRLRGRVNQLLIQHSIPHPQILTGSKCRVHLLELLRQIVQ